MCKRYETGRTKGTFKTSDINKTNWYLSNTYNEIFKTSLWFYNCSWKYSVCLYMCVCVWLTQLKLQKSTKWQKCPMHVDYVFLNVRFFLWFDAIAVFEAGKPHRQGILRKGMFAWPIHFVVFDGCWWIWESESILYGSHTGESVLALQVKMWKRGRVYL